MAKTARLVTFAVSVLVASSAGADDWKTPTQVTIQSPDHKLQAVISPAADRDSTATAAIGPKDHLGKPFALTTPEMPVDTVLFDDGSLLTFDRWGRLGFGNVATMYERGGKVRWTKTLEELLGPKLADAAPRSVSSIWWRKTPVELTIATDHKSALITLFDESQLKLMLADGRATIVAVAKLPDDPQRLLNRARALANEDGQQAAAIALLDRAIALDANQLEAVSLYVELLQRSKDHARVVALLDRVSPHWTTQTGYELANVCVAWATSLTALSRPSDAERVLRRAVVAAPEYPNPAIALAALLVDQGHRKDADVVLDDFVGRLFKAPDLDTYALQAAADFYRTHNDLAKALALYLKGYKRDQITNQFLYADLAQLYEQMHNDAEAIRIDEQLLDYFQKAGSAFDLYTKSTRAELDRLRRKPKRH